jgi:lipid-binding SYLF domain-containing protein
MNAQSMNLVRKGCIAFVCALGMTIVLLSSIISETYAASAKEIDVSVDVALENFVKQVKGGKEFLNSSKGVLVFPNVYKAGLLWVGGEYGEGALRINGKTVDYYNTAAGAFGPQLGAQKKTFILVFMQDGALRKFRDSPGWEIGIDGSVALIDVGLGDTIDSTTIKEPIVAFVFNQKGLMGNITLEGTKFTKLNKTP